jgi:flagellar assembly protein FliH
MQSWREAISFNIPVLNVRLAADEHFQSTIKAREEASYEKGVVDGERALSEQLLRQRGELLALQSGVFQSLREAFPELIRASEKNLVLLALEAAQKLVAECPITLPMIEAAVRETLARAESTSNLTIVLNPEDYAMLERANSPALLQSLGEDPLRVHFSSEVSRGGCLLQTKFGAVDGRRESKFELLKAALVN